MKEEPLSPAAGFFLPVSHLIGTTPKQLWSFAKGKRGSILQHEVVHLLSEQDSQSKPYLTAMNGKQIELLKKSYQSMRNRYTKNDNTLLGKWRSATTGKTSNGIRNYAFFNAEEFLTVTLDYFYKAPQLLCKTPEGKEVYQLYCDLLKIDPLRGYQDL